MSCQHLGMCVGGLLEVLRNNFCQNFEFFRMVQKVSGRVQGGPRSPPDSLTKYFIFRKSLFVQTRLFNAYWYCLVVLPIGPCYSLVEEQLNVFRLCVSDAVP